MVGRVCLSVCHRWEIGLSEGQGPICHGLEGSRAGCTDKNKRLLETSQGLM